MTEPRGAGEIQGVAGSAWGRYARLAGGWALLLIGAALLVLPGPGIPLVLGGLVLLAREYPWARRLEQRLRDRWRQVAGWRPRSSR